MAAFAQFTGGGAEQGASMQLGNDFSAWVALPAEHMVVQYDVRGRIVRRWRDEANAPRPVAVAVPEDRRELLVGDAGTAQVVVFDPLGRTLRLLAGRRGARNHRREPAGATARPGGRPQRARVRGRRHGPAHQGVPRRATAGQRRRRRRRTGPLRAHRGAGGRWESPLCGRQRERARAGHAGRAAIDGTSGGGAVTMARALLLPLAAGALLAGCAGEPRVMQLDGTPAESARVFPAPQTQEVPRYRYLGQLVGETNFRAAGGERSTARKLFAWVAGLTEQPDQPVVLQRPQSGVVDGSGRVLVTDVSRNAVFVFDEAGGKLDVWDRATATERFAAPIGIALGRNGELL